VPAVPKSDEATVESTKESGLMPGLLNYSTSITVDKTVGEIQKLLAKNGARSIMVEYDANGQPVALAFQIGTKLGLQGYRLPANLDAVFQVLSGQYSQGRVQRRFVTREQAARVGWRILKDWSEAQMALLETRMVAFEEIMLPWMIAGRDGETVFQLFESQQLALPAAGQTAQ
jgi:hypothetical protein